MANLFWRSKSSVKRLLSTPYETEEAFEKIVFDTSEILGDVFLLKRQIRGGSKAGIPDIVGVDSDGNICIIEMKNVTVDASIIPQVLQYAIWAETNPDSIKSLWLECDDKPDELTPSFDEFQVRILIVAPLILRNTLHMVDKINYPVDLIEVSRWVDQENEMLLVNNLDQEPAPKVKPVKGLQTYDENFYRSNYNEKSAVQFLRYARQVENLCRKNKWPLKLKFNKHYCSYKAGAFNAFGIKWIGSKTIAFFFKLPKTEAESFRIPMTRYEDVWKEANFYIEFGKSKVEDYFPLFEAAYNRLTGK